MSSIATRRLAVFTVISILPRSAARRSGCRKHLAVFWRRRLLPRSTFPALIDRASTDLPFVPTIRSVPAIERPGR